MLVIESDEFKALTKVMAENFGGIMLPDRPKNDATKIMQKLDELGYHIVSNKTPYIFGNNALVKSTDNEWAIINKEGKLLWRENETG